MSMRLVNCKANVLLLMHELGIEIRVVNGRYTFKAWYLTGLLDRFTAIGGIYCHWLYILLEYPYSVRLFLLSVFYCSIWLS